MKSREAVAMCIGLSISGCTGYKRIELYRASVEIPKTCRWVELQGIDTDVGEVRCWFGPIFSFDLGGLAGDRCGADARAKRMPSGVVMCSSEKTPLTCATKWGWVNFCGPVLSERDRSMLEHIAASFSEERVLIPKP